MNKKLHIYIYKIYIKNLLFIIYKYLILYIIEMKNKKYLKCQIINSQISNRTRKTENDIERI